MKRIVAALLLAALCGAAHAMTRASAPTAFAIPFADSAGSGYINYPVPTDSQIGILNCAASDTDGFPPKTMQPASAGGCAPFGQDMNGILKQITLWNQWNSFGGIVPYNSSLSSAIGGYPEGAILSQASNPYCFWISQIDNNASDPDTGGANWTGACPGGGAGGTSGGSANAQTITSTPFILQANARIYWTVGSGLTNTGPLQINVNGGGLVNVYQRTASGLAALVKGEVQAGTIASATYDGSQWELDVNAQAASLVNQDQNLLGGANVTSYSIGTVSTGTVTVDCGKGPLQYLVDAGTFTIAAPLHDGSCMILITNTTGAVAPTFSGFTVNSNTGEPFTTTSGNKFMVTILEINSVATYVVKSLQ